MLNSGATRAAALAITGLASAWPVAAPAYTLNSASMIASTDGSRNDVNAAIGAVSDGWTVTIPAGVFTWTNGIAISGKSVSLRGAGSGRIVGRSTSSVAIGSDARTFTTQSGLPLTTGQLVRVIHTANGGNFMHGTMASYTGTTLTINVSMFGGGGTEAFWVIATVPQTVITNSAGTAIEIAEAKSGNVQVSGIKFVDGANMESHIVIDRTNGGKPVLVHDCWMSSSVGAKMILIQTRSGLVWNCSFDAGFNSMFPSDAANVQGIGFKWADGTSTWATPSTFGTADVGGTTNFYVEDNDFHGMYLQSLDMDDNMRVVIRHNLFNNSAFVAHGQDTSPDGVRHYEIYENTFSFKDVGQETYNLALGYIFLRGGTGVIADNSFDDVNSSEWNDEPETTLTIQQIRRRAGLPECWHAGPPAPRQVGYGYVTGKGKTGPGGYQGDLEPLYAWNNSGTFVIALSNYQPDECGNNQHITDYIRPGVEYITGSAKPGYTKFTYPHPLRGQRPRPPVLRLHRALG
jgi:hypothetical protein